jgi:hypothetical protein
MTRDEVLAEIRRRAHREHGTAVRALLTILDQEVDGIRNHFPASGSDRDAGYADGMRNAAALVEDALFRTFELWPTGRPTAEGAGRVV